MANVAIQEIINENPGVEIESQHPTALHAVEEHFDVLSNITDQVAQINSIYETDIEGNLAAMENFIADARTWNLAALESDARQFYLSHMSFHREIVAEIIAEARQVLIDERRPYVKRLVNYHKSFSHWLSGIEKSSAA